MNLLDENFPEDQLPLLRAWHIPFRRIGHDLAPHGAKDDDLIPFLHRIRRVTLVTLDADFFDSGLCHPAYGLVWLDVRADDAAYCLRRFLAHPRFKTLAQRMGVVAARVHHKGIHFWERNCARLQRASWPAR